MTPSISWLWLAVIALVTALILHASGVEAVSAVALGAGLWLVLWLGLPLARRLYRRDEGDRR